jgi:hypothetical protein
MKSRRYKTRKNKSHKNKKGGFLNFLSSNQSVLPSQCDPNQLSMIKDKYAMANQYQKCCPKGMFGSKNSSPYCKQLDLNMSAQTQLHRDTAGYYGDESEINIDEIKSMSNAPLLGDIPKKPWYKFWGGKKSRRKINNKHNYSRKSRK